MNAGAATRVPDYGPSKIHPTAGAVAIGARPFLVAYNVYLGPAEDGIHWAFIRAAENSIADLSVIPLQDALGLDGSGRMNTPSRVEGNWRWRFSPDALTAELARKLAELVEVSDRQPRPLSAAGQQSDWEAREDFAA